MADSTYQCKPNLGTSSANAAEMGERVHSESARRPTYLSVIPEAIPEEIKTLWQWVGWKAAYRPAHHKKNPWAKVPKNPETRRNADPTASRTWGAFDLAVAYYVTDMADGIGFVLTLDDPYAGVDLDHCRDPLSGEIQPWAQAIVDQLQSYTEISPSGTGLRILLKARLPPDSRRKGAIEVYDAKRFVTLTGHHLAGTPTTIESRQEALEAWHDEVFAKASRPSISASHPDASCPREAIRTALADDAIVQKARHAKNGAKFARLMAGDQTGYPSPSEADLALCGILAFYTQDPAQIDRLFRRSGLLREKWDESRGEVTYGEMTIQKALGCVSEPWAPREDPEEGMPAMPTSPDLLSPLHTDMGNAERFVRHHGRNVKYCHAWGKWLIWHGHRWQIDEKDEVIQLAQDTMRLFRDQAHSGDAFDWVQDEQARAKKIKEASAWAIQSQSRRKILDALELAKSDRTIAVVASDLDRHRHLLNCPNGTLNLHTGELSLHRREDLLTKVTRGSYVPGATHPLWEKTLETFQPDDTMRRFLQRFLGSSLEGGNPQKKLGFAYGPKNSGKTTIFGSIVHALGDYAATTGVETFAERRDPGHSLNEMARFVGKRLIYAEHGGVRRHRSTPGGV
jgi:putative DNA primase/helicase